MWGIYFVDIPISHTVGAKSIDTKNHKEFLEFNPCVIITKSIRQQFMLCNPYEVPDRNNDYNVNRVITQIISKTIPGV